MRNRMRGFGFNKSNKIKRAGNLRIAIPLSILTLIILFLLAGGGESIIGYRNRKKEVKETQKALKEFNDAMNDFEETLKNDKFGGIIPQETLDMFIESLEKDDLDLAVKYFSLSSETSREQWKEMLIQHKRKGNLEEIIRKLKNAVPSNNVSGNRFQFLIINEFDEMVDSTIYLELNKFSGVWKIKEM